MRALHTIVILLLAVSVSFFVAGSAIADDNDQPGVASSDTSEDVVDESPDLAAGKAAIAPLMTVAPFQPRQPRSPSRVIRDSRIAR